MIVRSQKVDSRGRISLPAECRRRLLKSKNKVMIIQKGEEIIIKPITIHDISEFFDSMPADIKSDLRDWKNVKKELFKV